MFFLFACNFFLLTVGTKKQRLREFKKYTKGHGFLGVPDNSLASTTLLFNTVNQLFIFLPAYEPI